MEKLLPLKLSLWLKCNVVKDDAGVNVWQASHNNFNITANAETPEKAASLFGDLLQRAENKDVLYSNAKKVVEDILPEVVEEIQPEVKLNKKPVKK